MTATPRGGEPLRGKGWTTMAESRRAGFEEVEGMESSNAIHLVS